MAKNAFRFRAQMEPLERRETPGSAHALATSTTHPTVTVSGSGVGAVTQLSNQINSVKIESVTRGRASGLGTFTGNPKGFFYFNGHAIATDVLTASNGDTLDITLDGSVRLASTNTKEFGIRQLLEASPTSATASYHFKVTGGTGRFAGATGSGTVSETINAGTGGLHFSFNGRVKT
jgi:hypothetical protein